MVAANMAAITKPITAPPAAAIGDVVRAEMAMAMQVNADKFEEMKNFILELH